MTFKDEIDFRRGGFHKKQPTLVGYEGDAYNIKLTCYSYSEF